MGKRKKKGRPSLLDLQKRNLRLQNPNPNSTPSPSHSRRITRRNPNPDVHVSSSDDDSSVQSDSKKKKLKLVNRIPNSTEPESEPDKDEGKILKLTVAPEGALPNSGPTTPLPNEKLLVFILDRLQKKDTYGVFSDPVDPEELPDYHEIISHPMDFGTVRKKLSSGEYASFEQFEKDVFLISSNAMHYNSQDTVYYRQARAIQDLAKKSFDNLRQESDDNDGEPKTVEPKTVVRRGRPPSKNFKPAVVRASLDCAASDFSSNVSLANAGDSGHLSTPANDMSRKGSASKKSGAGDISAGATYNLRNTEPYSWTGMHKSEMNEDFPGNGAKGISTKNGKKLPVGDEIRRNTYYQPQYSSFSHESSILTTFDNEKKHLVPQHGLRSQHAYARSLARFAAKLGPIGWGIAAQKIEKILPPGTNYGRGWIGDNEAPRQVQPTVSSSSQTSSQPKTPLCSTTPESKQLPERLESSSAHLATEESHPITSGKPSSSKEVTSELINRTNHSGENSTQNTLLPQVANGFNLPSHVETTGKELHPSVPLNAKTQIIHARSIDMAERGINPGNMPDKGSWRNVSHQPKQGAYSPDMNVRFQSSVSSAASSVIVDSQQPDLALQL